MSDFATVVAGEEILEEHINQFASWLNGDDATYYAAAVIRSSDASNPTITVQNLTSPGTALRVLSHTGSVVAEFGNPGATLRHIVGGGTAISSGDIAISGWGSTGALSSVSGTDTACTFTVTPGGAGITANPTVIITLKLAYGSAPHAIPAFLNLTSGVATVPYWATTTSTVSLTYIGTPTSGQALRFTVYTIG